MARLIDAEDFKKFLQALCDAGAPHEDVIGLLDKQPTIEAEPVMHGKWITEGKHPFSPECSVCHKHGVQFAPVNYCPNCGARMDGE